MKLDTYTLQARIVPAVVTALPLVVLWYWSFGSVEPHLGIFRALVA